MLQNKMNKYDKFIGLASFLIMVNTCSIDFAWVFTDTGCDKNDINIVLLVNSGITIIYYIIYTFLMCYIDENRNEKIYLNTKISLFFQHVFNVIIGMPVLFILTMKHLTLCDSWFEMYMWVRIGISFFTSFFIIPFMYCTILRDAPYRYDVLQNTYNSH